MGWCTSRTAAEAGSISAVKSSLPTRSSDRKSTRLNSSHLGISYAVLFLQKNRLKAWNGGSTLRAAPQHPPARRARAGLAPLLHQGPREQARVPVVSRVALLFF